MTKCKISVPSRVLVIRSSVKYHSSLFLFLKVYHLVTNLHIATIMNALSTVGSVSHSTAVAYSPPSWQNTSLHLSGHWTMQPCGSWLPEKCQVLLVSPPVAFWKRCHFWFAPFI